MQLVLFATEWGRACEQFYPARWYKKTWAALPSFSSYCRSSVRGRWVADLAWTLQVAGPARIALSRAVTYLVICKESKLTRDPYFLFGRLEFPQAGDSHHRPAPVFAIFVLICQVWIGWPPKSHSSRRLCLRAYQKPSHVEESCGYHLCRNVHCLAEPPAGKTVLSNMWLDSEEGRAWACMESSVKWAEAAPKVALIRLCLSLARVWLARCTYLPPWSSVKSLDRCFPLYQRTTSRCREKRKHRWWVSCDSRYTKADACRTSNAQE